MGVEGHNQLLYVLTFSKEFESLIELSTEMVFFFFFFFVRLCKTGEHVYENQVSQFFGFATPDIDTSLSKEHET